jgi:hypothetical protein
MNTPGISMNYRQKGFSNRVIKMGDVLNHTPNSEFNWQQYLEKYPDLKRQGIINKELAHHHWINYGKNEGRTSIMIELQDTNDFDWVSYLSNNEDLVAAGINTKERAYNHWINVGKNEGRIILNERIKAQYEAVVNYKLNLQVAPMPQSLSIKYYTNSVSTLDSGKIRKIPPYNVHFTNDKIKSPPSSFMLIIDFPNYGGGTMFFLNTVLMQYKHKRNFVIARNFNGNVYFYINDDVMVNDAYDKNESVKFINYYKNNITNVFVNSTIGHDVGFLNAVFEMGKEITGITHDYSLLFDRPQFIYNDMEKLDISSPIDINRFNRIITQNEANLSIYKQYIHNPGTHLVVSPLPDYKDCYKKTQTNNIKTVVGIIGYISDIKGQHVVKRLIEISEKQGTFDVIIFGRVNIFYEKQYEYANIGDLNRLLNIYKPNIWIEASIWPETYSYTLSLMMLTQLPILYQKKTFPSVIENRLASYSNAYSFNNIETLDSYDIINKAQNHFYNISPVIYFNEFWDRYFSGTIDSVPPKSDSYNVVFISSKIYTSSAPFTYVEKRSIYTNEERFKQTMATIDSVRQYIPNSFIILFDNSAFQASEYNALNSRVDVFINNQSDKTIYNYTNVKTVKLYGELAQTAFVVNYIKDNLKFMNIRNFFKISGRYLINSTFDFAQYDNDFNIFKRNEAVVDRNYYYTSFYKIGGPLLLDYFKVINDMYIESASSPYDKYDWEVILPIKMNFKFRGVDTLGITQFIAAWNQKDKI